MADATDLIINDSTAVARTFGVDLVESKLIRYARTDAATYAANPSVSISRRPATTTNPNFKSTLKCQVPVTDVDGKVTHSILASLELVFPADTETSDIDNLVAYLSSSLDVLAITNALKNVAFPH